jgi:pantoate ligase / CMP/dCMP kinase
MSGMRNRVLRAPVITLDGPSGAGKTSVGHRAASILGFLFVDGGVLFRAVAWIAIQSGMLATDDNELAEMLRRGDLELRPTQDHCSPVLEILWRSSILQQELFSKAVEAFVPIVASQPGIHREITVMQRQLAVAPGLILAGRNAGSHVFPNAELKIWLTASLEVRARRRATQRNTSVETTIAELATRDAYDAHREIAPITVPHDSVIVETDGRDVDSITDELVTLARVMGL